MLGGRERPDVSERVYTQLDNNSIAVTYWYMIYRSIHSTDGTEMFSCMIVHLVHRIIVS